jgi:tRNA-dihydrouridine synthase C
VNRMTSSTLALAPMDGVTDHVYRELMTSRARRGALAFAVSEFVRVTDRPLPVTVLERSCPEIGRGGHTQAGTPVLLQLLGGRAEPLAATARAAVGAGAYGIDLNFGCPARLVNRHDGGAVLLKAPDRIEGIVAAVRAAVPADRPVGVKVRLGWECHDDISAIARAAENGGASWLTVHGRTKVEMYGPPADWASIGKARRALRIKTIANGDLNCEESLDRCRAESGCDTFMLGRGPMGRPSLLCGDARASSAGEVALVADLLVEYLERMVAARFGESLRVARVKQWLSLGTKVNGELRPLFESVKRLEAIVDVLAVLASFGPGGQSWLRRGPAVRPLSASRGS